MPLILFGILICLINFYELKDCSINGTTMNCARLNFTDCPTVNENILELILDDNLLETFSSVNCKTWSNLQRISVKKNKLKNFVSANVYKLLENLDLSYNNIKEFSVNEKQLLNIDISHNQISVVKYIEGNQLNYFYVNNNNIDNASLDNIIRILVRIPSLKVLDFSYNKFSSLPSSLMSLNSNQFLSINFSGNQLSKISFNIFSSFKINPFNLDISSNKITEVKIPEIIEIRNLNFSNNQLTTIDPEYLNNLENLINIDISHNPLNCLCSESMSFMEWMHNNSHKLVNKNETNCKTPPNTRVIDVDCWTSTSTKSSITISTNHSNRIPLDNKSWAIPLGIFISILLLVIVFYYCYWRRRGNYQKLEELRSSIPSFSCDCLPLTFLRPRSETDCLINDTNNDNVQYTFNDSRLNFDKSLNVICSRQDKKWVTDKIMCNLDIQKNLICSKKKNIKYGDYTLVIVNDNHCLKDYNLINNLQMCSEGKISTDIRLLVNKMPNYNDFENASFLTDFIKNKVSNNAYFMFNPDKPSICIANLRIWLNLANIPHNV